MKAILKNYKQSPRKVRLVANAVRGKSVKDALITVQSLNKKVSLPLHKLITSAINNAEQAGKKMDDLKIDSIYVNQGIVLKRFRPRAFGRAAPLRKRTSTIHLHLN